ncbi:MAG: crossover junction endodeoxyribonuclease RuvC [Planctomycetes bacterium]|nr:crossover junction endodeoxyribonuclease RuvC [Planctomycetota bacterium]
MPFEALSRTDPLIVLGIDPGTLVLGFGVVGRSGGKLQHVDHGALRADAKSTVAERLKVLAQGVRALLAHHRPHVVALEEAFVDRNVQSALRIGEARGIVLCAAAEAGIPVVDFPTARVKARVGGHGAATKSCVRSMVMLELALKTAPTPLDASDALALALALLHDRRLDPRFAALKAPKPKSRSRPRR